MFFQRKHAIYDEQSNFFFFDENNYWKVCNPVDKNVFKTLFNVDITFWRYNDVVWTPKRQRVPAGNKLVK